jgi:hypothetical protein
MAMKKNKKGGARGKAKNATMKKKKPMVKKRGKKGGRRG